MQLKWFSPQNFTGSWEYAPRQLAVTDENVFVNSAQSSLYQLVPSDFILHRTVISAEHWDLNWWDSRGGLELYCCSTRIQKSIEPFSSLMKKSPFSMIWRGKVTVDKVLIAAHNFLQVLSLLEPGKPLWSALAPQKCEPQQTGSDTMQPPVFYGSCYRSLIS